ncbi:hypothetical protein PCANC_05241 [Puccinia coronata f. sp. avenae]|uniref:Uncharacterized protein n=1 Tax=Puccinia coronata f. sp. avenae TaxID=200324 RepID=A0A2N5TAA2_9BASI|nr:hypothetical protein PCASD_13456 [Puccinia coronata f. sp. avenae]PLW37183.1 hypothetical protein PCASD_11132 [Puccinia coronata f. sp. avenae]PLW54256.1 hypothetical protein PCANC_05241 [Puccinia coronata f. sp. avenae]
MPSCFPHSLALTHPLTCRCYSHWLLLSAHQEALNIHPPIPPVATFVPTVSLFNFNRGVFFTISHTKEITKPSSFSAYTRVNGSSNHRPSHPGRPGSFNDRVIHNYKHPNHFICSDKLLNCPCSDKLFNCPCSDKLFNFPPHSLTSPNLALSYTLDICW